MRSGFRRVHAGLQAWVGCTVLRLGPVGMAGSCTWVGVPLAPVGMAGSCTWVGVPSGLPLLSVSWALCTLGCEPGLGALLILGVACAGLLAWVGCACVQILGGVYAGLQARVGCTSVLGVVYAGLQAWVGCTCCGLDRLAWLGFVPGLVCLPRFSSPSLWVLALRNATLVVGTVRGWYQSCVAARRLCPRSNW